MKIRKIILVQLVFVIASLTFVYFMYPRTTFEISNNSASFKSINANVILISENPDFTNARRIDLSKDKNTTLDLVPGTYYWKPVNTFVNGISKTFTIDSNVGMEIKRKENESDLVNVGNVKINITKSKDGIMTGRIILEPNESEIIEDRNEDYVGRQE